MLKVQYYTRGTWKIEEVIIESGKSADLPEGAQIWKMFSQDSETGEWHEMMARQVILNADILGGRERYAEELRQKIEEKGAELPRLAQVWTDKLAQTEEEIKVMERIGYQDSLDLLYTYINYLESKLAERA